MVNQEANQTAEQRYISTLDLALANPIQRPNAPTGISDHGGTHAFLYTRSTLCSAKDIRSIDSRRWACGIALNPRQSSHVVLTIEERLTRIE